MNRQIGAQYFTIRKQISDMDSFDAACKKVADIGYKIVASLGHTIIPVLPALVQINLNASFLKDWHGIRQDGMVSLYQDNKLILFIFHNQNEFIEFLKGLSSYFSIGVYLSFLDLSVAAFLAVFN